jgi:hypothetical protein
MGFMAHSMHYITDLVLRQLRLREMRVLSLVVAVRKNLLPTEVFKGDLTAAVKSALRKLVAEQIVMEEDGTFTLAPTVRN